MFTHHIATVSFGHEGLKIASDGSKCLIEDGLNKAHAPCPGLAFVAVHVSSDPRTQIAVVKFAGNVFKVLLGILHDECTQVRSFDVTEGIDHGFGEFSKGVYSRFAIHFQTVHQLKFPDHLFGLRTVIAVNGNNMIPIDFIVPPQVQPFLNFFHIIAFGTSL